MASANHEVEKFTGQNNQSMVDGCCIGVIVITQGLSGEDKLLAKMSMDEKDDLYLNTCNAIQFCLADKVLREVENKNSALVCGSN